MTISPIQGNIGLLDASKSSYSTLMRSHREAVQCMSVTGSDVAGVCLVSCSLDHTIRVWDSTSGKQVRSGGNMHGCNFGFLLLKSYMQYI